MSLGAAQTHLDVEFDGIKVFSLFVFACTVLVHSEAAGTCTEAPVLPEVTKTGLFNSFKSLPFTSKMHNTVPMNRKGFFNIMFVLLF